jgi:hypothetical protein
MDIVKLQESEISPLAEIAKELVKIRAELKDSNNKLEFALKELDYIRNNMREKPKGWDE